MKRFFVVTSLGVLLLAMPGCGFLSQGITYYDSTTYKNLTDLKPEVALLYEGFTLQEFDSVGARGISLKLAQIFEYEKGKGPENRTTFEQIGILRDMIQRHVDDRVQRGPWSAAHRANEVENMSDAFDIAIQTEQLKNKSNYSANVVRETLNEKHTLSPCTFKDRFISCGCENQAAHTRRICRAVPHQS